MPDQLVEAMIVTDPVWVRRLKAKRERSPSSHRDEVWEGVYVVSPTADLEHQFFAQELWSVCRDILPFVGGGIAYNVVNVSDRIKGWMRNYREPDIGVYLKANPAIKSKAHICGGPDLAVEILSDGDMARQKRDFYANVNTRELLLLDRDPWVLELHRLVDARLVLVGTSSPEKGDSLTSEVLPLHFRLIPGDERPTLEVARVDGSQLWRI